MMPQPRRTTHRAVQSHDSAANAPRAAGELDASLVVMGAYGQWRLRQLVLGTCTEDPLRRIKRPILLMHSGCFSARHCAVNERSPTPAKVANMRLGHGGYVMGWRAATALTAAIYAGVAQAQPARMTDEQQAWFYCLVSKKWCVASSADTSKREQKLVAMVSANKPAHLHGHVSRVTIQIACSEGKPVTMLMTGREVDTGDIALHYRVTPSGKTGSVTATQVSAGYFFEIKNESLLNDWRNGTKATVDLSFPSDPKPSTVEYDLTGMEGAVKRLGCF